jgi:peptidyl-prolyl cis-trans isomerase D
MVVSEFAKIAEKETDEVSGRTKGGDLGWFTRETMVKAFSDKAFSMKVGEISSPVESPFGFHIIKVEGKKEAKTTELKEAESQIAAKILEKEKRPQLASALAQTLLDAVKQGKESESLKSHGVAWQATGEFAANNRSVPGIGYSKEVQQASLSLKNKGQVHDAYLTVRSNHYIVRLKSRVEADLKKLDGKKREDLASSAALSNGFALYTALQKGAKGEWENKVKRNQDYLALDNRQRGDGS